MREIEIKLKVTDLKPVIDQLEALGCALSAPITQTDINFIHRDDVKWFEPLISDWVYPRLRIESPKDETGTANHESLILTVKKPLKNESDCREHEIRVDDPEEVRGMMDMFGYKEGVTVKKIRRKASLQGYALTLDTVEKLGNFIEIERVISDDEAEKLGAEKIQEEMTTFAEKTLGLKRSDVVLQGYDIQMYYALL